MKKKVKRTFYEIENVFAKIPMADMKPSKELIKKIDRIDKRLAKRFEKLDR